MSTATAISDPFPLPERRLLDEESGVFYTEVVQLWPTPTDLLTPTKDSCLYNGNIWIHSDQAESPVEFKLRVASKQRHKQMFRCHEGRGLLQPRELHRIRVQVPEEAVESSRFQLLLNGKKLELRMEKCPEGERFYKQIVESEAELAGKKEEEKAEKRGKKEKRPWKMDPQKLISLLPETIEHYIKNEQAHNLRRALFLAVYPLVQEMLYCLSARDELLLSPTAAAREIYFDCWEDAGDPMELILDYVLLKLEQRAVSKNEEEIA